jgi:hypothetical protein
VLESLEEGEPGPCHAIFIAALRGLTEARQVCPDTPSVVTLMPKPPAWHSAEDSAWEQVAQARGQQGRPGVAGGVQWEEAPCLGEGKWLNVQDTQEVLSPLTTHLPRRVCTFLTLRHPTFLTLSHSVTRGSQASRVVCPLCNACGPLQTMQAHLSKHRTALHAAMDATERAAIATVVEVNRARLTEAVEGLEVSPNMCLQAVYRYMSAV